MYKLSLLIGLLKNAPNEEMCTAIIACDRTFMERADVFAKHNNLFLCFKFTFVDLSDAKMQHAIVNCSLQKKNRASNTTLILSFCRYYSKT